MTLKIFVSSQFLVNAPRVSRSEDNLLPFFNIPWSADLFCFFFLIEISDQNDRHLEYFWIDVFRNFSKKKKANIEFLRCG